jgi:predicted transcriptional regulator of viral defense system
MNHAARHALRFERMPALLDDIRAQILAAQKSALTKSATGKAAHYTLALWRRLICFLTKRLQEQGYLGRISEGRRITRPRKLLRHFAQELRSD